jgi:Zn-dependent protease with chaperone function
VVEALQSSHAARFAQAGVRCDELACHLAGSESLEKGLCSVSRAAATFAPYWNQIVRPVAAGGYRPELADGYGRFLDNPEIAKAASAALEKQLATNATNPMDSHPPLNARVRNARSLAIATAPEDAYPRSPCSKICRRLNSNCWSS